MITKMGSNKNGYHHEPSLNQAENKVSHGREATGDRNGRCLEKQALMFFFFLYE